MRLLIIVSAFLVIQSCASGPKVDYSYSSDSRVAIVNAVSSSARYYSFKLLKPDIGTYPVDWSIPELVESTIRNNSSMRFVSVTAPESMVGIELGKVRKTIQSNNNSPIKNEISSICAKEDLAAVIILGTINVNWQPVTGGFTYIAHGYGIYRETTGGDPYAYGIVAAAIVNCEPLDYAGIAWFHRSPIKLEDFDIPKEADQLTQSQLSAAKPFVMEALSKSATGKTEDPLEQIAQQIEEILQ